MTDWKYACISAWLILRSARVFIRYMKSFHCETEIPSCCLTRCGLNSVLCGTFTLCVMPSTAMVKVLLQTTRTEVGVATVANEPSQDVASSR